MVAERFAPDIVSTVAVASWEWPPSVCGRHHDEALLAPAAAWAVASGGAGVTLSWGCAHDAADLAERLLRRQAA